MGEEAVEQRRDAGSYISLEQIRIKQSQEASISPFVIQEVLNIWGKSHVCIIKQNMAVTRFTFSFFSPFLSTRRHLVYEITDICICMTLVAGLRLTPEAPSKNRNIK